MKNKQNIKAAENVLSSGRLSFILFSAVLILIPLSFWRGFENSFDLVKAAVIYTTGGLFIFFTALGRFKDGAASVSVDLKLDVIFLAFVLSVVLSAIFSPNFYVSFFGTYERQTGLLLFLSLYIVYLLASVLIHEKKQVNHILMILEISGVIIASVSIIQFIGLNIFDLKPANFSRPFTPAGHPTFSAGVMTFIFPIALLNVNGKKNISLRILVIVIIAAGILATLTRASFAGVVVQLALAVIFMPRILRPDKYSFKSTLKLFLLYFAVVSVIFSSLWFIFPENIFFKRISTLSTITSQPRWYLWHDSFEMFKQNFLTGTGLGIFSNEFEKYASYNLKLSEVRGVFDNAHNNTLNILCTTGVFACISYVLMLLYAVSSLIGKLLNNINEKKKAVKILFLLSSFTGYIIYGLADFDDITMTFFLFIFLFLFKTVNNSVKYSIPKTPIRIISCVLIIMSVYSVYTGFIMLKAEKYYSSAVKNYRAGRFNEFINDGRVAINTLPGQSVYRYNYANMLIDHSLRMSGISGDEKKRYFEEAKQEVKAAQKNFNSNLQCLGLISLIELYSGNETEGFRLKDEIYKTDTCQFAYRNNIAGYYLQTGKDGLALYELNILLKCDPKNPVYLKTYVVYLLRQKQYNEAVSICKKILEIDPGSSFAKNTLNQLKEF